MPPFRFATPRAVKLPPAVAAPLVERLAAVTLPLTVRSVPVEPPLEIFREPPCTVWLANTLPTVASPVKVRLLPFSVGAVRLAALTGPIKVVEPFDRTLMTSPDLPSPRLPGPTPHEL
jgi:hypothetical protein